MFGYDHLILACLICLAIGLTIGAKSKKVIHVEKEKLNGTCSFSFIDLRTGEVHFKEDLFMTDLEDYNGCILQICRYMESPTGKGCSHQLDYLHSTSNYICSVEHCGKDNKKTYYGSFLYIHTGGAKVGKWSVNGVKRVNRLLHRNF